MRIHPKPISLIILPSPKIHLTINMRKLPPSLRFPTFPFTFIFGAVRPDLEAVSISFAVEPLAGVFRPIFEYVFGSVLSNACCSRLIIHINILNCLLKRKIFTRSTILLLFFGTKKNKMFTGAITSIE